MCGLAGIVAPAGVDATSLSRLGTVLAHRGPDGEAFLTWRLGGPLRATPEPDRDPSAVVGFAHRRLSILDLSHAGDQPMVDRAGELALIYNGELYNYVELREELRALGHEFRGTGDTEVLLAAYREWGRDCVTRIVGMWAFAILDARDATLLLSRDRFGIKPLYWTRQGDRLAFASEIKALLAVGAPREPNERVVRRYLLTGRVDESTETFFAGIEQLAPAHDAVDRPARPGGRPAAAPLLGTAPAVARRRAARGRRRALRRAAARRGADPPAQRRAGRQLPERRPRLVRRGLRRRGAAPHRRRPQLRPPRRELRARRRHALRAHLHGRRWRAAPVSR